MFDYKNILKVKSVYKMQSLRDW